MIVVYNRDNKVNLLLIDMILDLNERSGFLRRGAYSV
jgi:hypothetical protein